jgi:AcrR family transcriptional regulator
MVYPKSKRPSTTRQSDAALTRLKLVSHARMLFAEGGQAAVGVIEVSKSAGVTTGALYHHFAKRQDLLRAVLEDVAGSVAERSLKAMTGHDDPWERLTVGITAVLDACLEPDVRFAYNEAAAILGLEEWRAMEESKTGVLLVQGLLAVKATGHLKPVSLELLAAMVKGAMVEAAMSITRAARPKQVRREAGELLEVLLAGLRT